MHENTDPPHLSQILGVTPFYQLIPKQDLAPLVSFSRVQPETLEPKSFLPLRSQKLFDVVEREQATNPEAVNELMAKISENFRKFDDAELNMISFKRPVIAGETEKPPILPEIDPMFNSLYSNEDCVRESDLVEFGNDLDLPNYIEDQLQLPKANESKEQVVKQLIYYQKKFNEELASQKPDRKRRNPQNPSFSRVTRRKIVLDRSKLKDSRLVALYNFLDLLESDENPDLDSEVPVEPVPGVKYTFTTEENGLLLTKAGVLEIGKRLSDLSESSGLSACHVEYLKLILTLSLNTVRHTHSGSDKFSAGTIHCAIEACSILLTILNTNTEHRELYLQSYVDCVLSYLSEVLPKIINSTAFNPLVISIIDCLEKLSVYLTTSTSDEKTLTQVEYMCISSIFLDGKIKDIEQLRNALVRILTRIFKSYEGQRQFIVNEMLSNISKLALSKGLPRQVPVAPGVKVSFFTVFLVDLIQTFDALDFKSDASAVLLLPKTDNPSGSANMKRGILLNGISTVLEEASSVANQVAEFFVTRLSTTTALQKSIFTGLMEDLFTMMSIPEFPGAETAVSVIVLNLESSMKAQKIATSEEPFILDIIGKFGLACLELKIKSKSYVLKIEDELSNKALSNLKGQHQCILHHLKDQSPKSAQLNSLYQFQLLKTLVFYRMLFENSTATKRKNQYFNLISNEDKHLSQQSLDIMEIIDLNLSTLSSELISFDRSADSLSNPNKKYRSLILATTLDKIYNEFLALLTVCLESTKVKLAAKAIRILSPLVTKDPRILLHQRINASISKILVKGSALSKDAVIDLLGQYMFSSKEHIAKYHALIGERSGDDGISVRKRVIKIMRNVFNHTDDVEIMSFAASKILNRLEDEETSIVEAARMSLNTLIFETQDFSAMSEVMIHLSNSGKSTCDTLVNFIQRELRSPLHKKERFQILKKIFDTAFDAILDTIDSSELKKTERAFSFISALAECDSELVTQHHLISLQPFLVDDIFEQEVVCFSALRILKLVLPNMRILRPDYVMRTNAILLKQLTKFHIRELHEAVQIIEVFSQTSGSSPLAKAAISSMKLLWPVISQGNSGSPAIETPKIRKVLHLLGCFGSYCNFEHMKDIFAKANIGLKEKESIVSLISRYLLFFCRYEDDAMIKVAAIKNLMCIASHHPKLFLSESLLGILDSGLHSSSQKIKSEIVRGLTQFLKKEDEKLVKTNADSIKSSKDTNADKTEFFGDKSNITDGVCSSVIQRYIKTILELCLQDVSEVGVASVSFLQVVTKLGFANPKVCVATVIALEASPEKHIKKIATELHSEIFDKHESLADRSYVEAIRMACDYSKRAEAGGHLRNFSFLRSVYRIVNATYSSKKKFISSVAKLFHVKASTTDLSEAIALRDHVVFLALNLSVLNFTSMEEVCLLIFHLNWFITGEGIDLADRISATVSSMDGKGMSVANLQLLFVFSQTALALVFLRQTLAASYSVRPSMMDGFRPSKPEMELRQSPKLVAFVNFPVGELALETKLSNPTLFGGLFTRLVQSTKDYSM